MILNEISRQRIINQQLARPSFDKVKDLVGWMGAMQAQDYLMAKWAIGIRLPHSSEKEVEEAFDNGEIIRTHLLRPTWHIVKAEDLRWLLELTAPKIRNSMASRRKGLELTPQLLSKTNDLIVNLLTENGHLSREEITIELTRNGIGRDNNRIAHVLMEAELYGLICSGKIKDGKPSYALVSERIPRTKNLVREEAVSELAMRYFKSHGPATIHDFSWWSGLNTGEARRSLESVKSGLQSVNADSATYWFDGSGSVNADSNFTHLLPAYDEFIISYRDRTPSFTRIDNNKIISENGIFKPVVVADGQVTGLWKRTIRKNKVYVEINLLSPVKDKIKKELKKRSEAYAGFLQKEVDMTFI